MQIAAEFQKVTICIDEDGLIATLTEMAASSVTAVIVDPIGGVKAVHEAFEVCIRCCD